MHETYNRRGMSNMQLNDGPHGAWAGACRTSSVPMQAENADSAGLNRFHIYIYRDSASVESTRGGSLKLHLYIHTLSCFIHLHIHLI